MKKVVIVIGFCLSSLLIFSQTGNEKNVNGILKISYNNYVGGEVFKLLLNDNVRSYQDFMFFDNESKPCILGGAIVGITDNIDLEIHIAKPLYITPNDDCKWDKNLFYKEIINRIRVFQNDICIIDTNPSADK